MDIIMSNLNDKSFGRYKDLSFTNILFDFEVFSFTGFVEEILTKENERLNSGRIDIHLDQNIIRRWELPFDKFAITLYQEGYELEEKKFTSNYMYMEMGGFDHTGLETGGNRTLWIDLYYSKEDYNCDDVFRDILREINNFKNRDFKEYLKEFGY